MLKNFGEGGKQDVTFAAGGGVGGGEPLPARREAVAEHHEAFTSSYDQPGGVVHDGSL